MELLSLERSIWVHFKWMYRYDVAKNEIHFREMNGFFEPKLNGITWLFLSTVSLIGPTLQCSPAMTTDLGPIGKERGVPIKNTGITILYHRLYNHFQASAPNVITIFRRQMRNLRFREAHWDVSGHKRAHDGIGFAGFHSAIQTLGCVFSWFV